MREKFKDLQRWKISSLVYLWLNLIKVDDWRSMSSSLGFPNLIQSLVRYSHAINQTAHINGWMKRMMELNSHA
jgi:hypothetical protein